MNPGVGPPATDPVTPPRRRFTLADGMILVVGAAVGFALIRHSETQLMRSGMLAFIRYGSGVSLGLSSAHLGLRLRGPREPWKLVTRQPGAAVGLVALTLLALDTLMIFMPTLLVPWRRQQVFPLDDLGAVIGSAMVGIWALAIASGSIERRVDWVEWLGRAIGLGWIAIFFVFFWDFYA